MILLQTILCQKILLRMILYKCIKKMRLLLTDNELRSEDC